MSFPILKAVPLPLELRRSIGSLIVFFKDDIYGIAYAINDDLAISYNVIESTQHAKDGVNDEQESKSINAAYTIGGLTIAFADAKTSNSGYVKDTDNDTRTLSVKTAF